MAQKEAFDWEKNSKELALAVLSGFEYGEHESAIMAKHPAAFLKITEAMQEICQREQWASDSECVKATTDAAEHLLYIVREDNGGKIALALKTLTR